MKKQVNFAFVALTALVLASSAAASAAEPVKLPPPDRVHLFLLIGQSNMGNFADSPWSEAKKQVDKAHRDLPAKVPHTAFVSAEDLRHKGDKVHFDAACYREFGRRYAEAYMRVNRRSPSR